MNLKITIFLAFALLGILQVKPVDNPVVTIYDGCIMRFGGNFYAMGTGTSGNIYWSADLVHWSGPKLVAYSNEAQWLSNTSYQGYDEYPRIGAGDLLYYNGLFHIYFNGIGHSVSLWPTEKFKETSITEPFNVWDIDPQLFIDDDGSPIFIKKVQSVNPITGANLGSDPKQTWMFPLKTPFSFGANPVTGDKQGVFLNSGEKGRNDLIDKNNFEGPELYKYRNCYYLLNAANCMSARTGLYNSYLTTAPSLASLHNNQKYPLPPLERNLERFHRQYKVLAPFAEYGEWKGRMVTTSPSANWVNPDFDDSTWPLKSMGIGAPKQDRAVDIRHVRTLWNDTWAQVWIRREFTIDELPANPFLLYHLEGGAEYYLNGVKIFTETGSWNAYRTKEIPASAFVKGRNVLAIRCTPASNTRYMDVGVYDAGSLKTEQPVVGPSQPNLFTGLNGFEQFVAYKAFWNGVSGQGVDRVFYYNKEMVMDGPTTASSNGIHYNPSRPSLYESFATVPDTKFWEYKLSDWKVSADKLLPQSDYSQVITKGKTGNYFIEVSFSLPKLIDANAGLFVAYANERNNVSVVISRKNNTWAVRTLTDSVLNTKTFALPDNFMFFEPNTFLQETTPAIHELRAYRNGTHLSIWLDHFLLTKDSDVLLPSADAMKTGIFQSGKQAVFEHLTMTKGWDEWDKNITGWDNVEEKWSVSENGLSPIDTNTTTNIITKGDFLTNYNFECNVDLKYITDTNVVNIFPVYTNADNFVKASFDTKRNSWVVSGKVQGAIFDTQTLPLATKVMRGHELDATYNGTPPPVYRYKLKGESKISQIAILWMEGSYPFLTATFGLPQKVAVQYKNSKGLWQTVTNQYGRAQKFSEYNTITFDPVVTSEFRVVITQNGATPCRPYDIEVTVDQPSTFFFRSVRTGNRLQLFYNNEPLAVVNGAFPASGVALAANTANCTFNGIMCYQNTLMDVSEISTNVIATNQVNSDFEVVAVNQKLTIKTASSMPYTVEVYNQRGCKICQFGEMVGSKQLKINELNHNLYIVKIKTIDNKVITRKIII